MLGAPSEETRVFRQMAEALLAEDPEPEDDDLIEIMFDDPIENTGTAHELPGQSVAR